MLAWTAGGVNETSKEVVRTSPVATQRAGALGVSPFQCMRGTPGTFLYSSQLVAADSHRPSVIASTYLQEIWWLD